MRPNTDHVRHAPLWKVKLDQIVCSTLINPANPNRKRWVERDEAYLETHTVGLIDILRKNFGTLTGLRLLDLGCGSGLDTINLVRAGALVTGVDVVHELIEVAQLRAASENVSAKFISLDNRNEWYWSGYYDAVIVIDVLEHAEGHERIVADCMRLLRPRGLVILTTTNRWALKNILADPHWKLFGVTLLPRVLAEAYLVRIRRILRRYDVTIFKSLPSLRKLLAGQGFRELEDNVSDTIEKLTLPSGIRGSFKRWAAKALSGISRAKPLRTWLAWLYCYAFVQTWRIVGRKPIVPS